MMSVGTIGIMHMEVEGQLLTLIIRIVQQAPLPIELPYCSSLYLLFKLNLKANSYVHNTKNTSYIYIYNFQSYIPT